jgi:hypothetical protein
MLPICHPIRRCLLHRQLGKAAQQFYPAPRFLDLYRTSLRRPSPDRYSHFCCGAGPVDKKPWFYRNAEEWTAMAQRLKQTPCPHC